MELYFDGQHYDCRYDDYKVDKTFWRNFIKDKHGIALDLCAGTGRLTRIFSDNFEEVTGVDNSNSMLEQGRKKNSDKKNINWICSSIEDMEFDKQFDYIFMGGLSLGGFDKEGLKKILSRIDLYLKPGGSFVFDGLTCNSIGKEVLNPIFRYQYKHPNLGTIRVFYKNKIMQNMEKIDLYYHMNKSIFKDYRTIHYHEIDYIKKLVSNKNYEIEFLYADYKMRKFDQSSKMFIISLRKDELK